MPTKVNFGLQHDQSPRNCEKANVEMKLSLPRLSGVAERTIARDAAGIELDLAEEGVTNIDASVLRHGDLSVRGETGEVRAEGRNHKSPARTRGRSCTKCNRLPRLRRNEDSLFLPHRKGEKHSPAFPCLSRLKNRD